MFPTWPAKSELGHKDVKKNASPKPPEGGEFGKHAVSIIWTLSFFLLVVSAKFLHDVSDSLKFSPEPNED